MLWSFYATARSWFTCELAAHREIEMSLNLGPLAMAFPGASLLDENNAA